jgi:hypothetical protein
LRSVSNRAVVEIIAAAPSQPRNGGIDCPRHVSFRRAERALSRDFAETL